MIFLDPQNDIAFKKIFGSEEHKAIAISFLNSLLELTGEKTIRSIEFLNTEQLPQTQEKKDNILDVFCIDQAGNKYIVEMQVGRMKDSAAPMEYYGAKAYSAQRGKGRSYYELVPVIVLALVNFVMFPEKSGYKSIHKILDVRTHEHDLHELSVAFVELPKFTKKEEQLVSAEDKWLYFMKEIKKKDHVPAALDEGEFAEACSIAERMKWSEQDLYAYDDVFIKTSGYEATVDQARGLGRQEGREENQRAMVKKLLKKLSVEEVADLTGLSVDDVNAIK